MITAEEVHIGNRFFWKPAISDTVMLIQVEIASVLQDKVGYTRSHLEHRVEPFEDDPVTKKINYAAYNELQPIPLTDEVLQKIDIKDKYPGWIKNVHELQNWFIGTIARKNLPLMINVS